MRILTSMRHLDDESRTFDVLVRIKQPEKLRQCFEALDHVEEVIKQLDLPEGYSLRVHDTLDLDTVGMTISRISCPGLREVVDGTRYRLSWGIPDGCKPPVKWRSVRSMTAESMIYLGKDGVSIIHDDPESFLEWEAFVGWGLMSDELEKAISLD